MENEDEVDNTTDMYLNDNQGADFAAGCGMFVFFGFIFILIMAGC